MQNYILDGIETERLRFRKLTDDDFEAWLPFFKSEEAVKFFNYSVDNAEQHCREWIAKIKDRYTDNNGMMVLEHKQTRELVGQCGLLKHHVDGVDELEIGYNILLTHWGNGYATEAAQKCKEAGFELGLQSIISIISPNNDKSIRVAERNGMTLDKRTVYRGMEVDIYRVNSNN